MFNSSDYYECTKKCKHTPHGNLITSAITKRSIDETYLISYISKICRNFLENTDDKVSFFKISLLVYYTTL